ncbi:MAG: peptidyl-prolyl cis-trans isomerase, partial [Nitrospirota bacterium]|nr:peptidyl-prolyl cis-trans isomerase [Nitrospirota bacterium]
MMNTGSIRTRSKLLCGMLLVTIFCSAAPLHASEQKLPVIDGEEIVAKVADDTVTLAEYNRLLSSVHSDPSDKKDEKQAARIDYKGILQRLITMRLVRLEAINMGLNELPEVQELMAQYSRQTLIGLLRGLHVRGMEADEEEIERLYKEAVMEFKLNSVLFDKKEAADRVSAGIGANGDFDKIIKKTIADGTAKGRGEGEYIKGRDLVPKIMEAVAGMKTGSVSPVIELSYGYIIFRLEDTRLPEDVSAREDARKQALEYKRKKALEEYKDAMISKY